MKTTKKLAKPAKVSKRGVHLKWLFSILLAGFGLSLFGQFSVNYGSPTWTTGSNSSFGYQALKGLHPSMTGTMNTALGHRSLFGNDTGTGNTAGGFRSLVNNEYGNYNTAFGTWAMATSRAGSEGTAIGYRAMERMNSQSQSFINQNVAVGAYAMQGPSLSSLNTGNQNTALGYQALMNVRGGSSNVALGFQSMDGNTSGSCNTTLGANSDVAYADLNNATALGCNAIVNASNNIRLGDANVIKIESVPFTAVVSDGRFKTNIRENDVVGLPFIQKLRPVVYNFDTRRFTEFLTQNMPDSVAAHYLADDFVPSTAIRQSGFIAQEVEQAAKEVGYDFNGVHVPENEHDNYSLAYAQFVVPLVKGMQEQQAMIESRDVEVEALKSQLAAQQAQLAELKSLVTHMAQTCCTGAGAGTSTGAPAQGGTKTSVPAIDPASPAHPVEVFPNPSAGRFTVRIAPLEQGHYEVFDQHGQLILRQPLTPGQTEYTVDLSGKASGSYLLRLHSHCGPVATKQLVVE